MCCIDGLKGLLYWRFCIPIAAHLADGLTGGCAGVWNGPENRG